jgi:uncharacterized protein with GYD domain
MLNEEFTIRVREDWKEFGMPKYMIQARFLGGDGVQGLLKDGGTARRAAVEQLFQSLGGRVEAFYFAFGETDVVIIGELPDNVSAAAGTLRSSASGLVVAKTTVLLTPEEIDQATRKSVTYRPPGQ